jgi:hypothetical protein
MSGRHVVLPPFLMQRFDVDDRWGLLDPAFLNPYPTDVLLDTSIFSIGRVPLVREILRRSSPVLLPPVLNELEDLKTKPNLAEVRDLVFPRGVLNSQFRGDDNGVLRSYRRVALRYASLLHWRKSAIEVRARRVVREGGKAPVGKARAKLIQSMLDEGMAPETVKLANKGHRSDRIADEILAVFSVLGPIVSGRDCFLYTADGDVLDQVIRMSQMLYDDYGGFLIARDYLNNESRYTHRHSHNSDLFIGEAMAIGRIAAPDYLLPPPMLVNTCATTVIDVSRLKGFTWISARNIEPAVAFQEQDPLARKGDPGDGNDIVFALPHETNERPSCGVTHHFAIGKPAPLRTSDDSLGPMSMIDLARAMMAGSGMPSKKSRILSPFAAHNDRLMSRARAAWRRRSHR